MVADTDKDIDIGHRYRYRLDTDIDDIVLEIVEKLVTSIEQQTSELHIYQPQPKSSVGKIEAAENSVNSSEQVLTSSNINFDYEQRPIPSPPIILPTLPNYDALSSSAATQNVCEVKICLEEYLTEKPVPATFILLLPPFFCRTLQVPL